MFIFYLSNNQVAESARESYVPELVHELPSNTIGIYLFIIYLSIYLTN